jgi:hypothetical protein
MRCPRTVCCKDQHCRHPADKQYRCYRDIHSRCDHHRSRPDSSFLGRIEHGSGAKQQGSQWWRYRRYRHRCPPRTLPALSSSGLSLLQGHLRWHCGNLRTKEAQDRGDLHRDAPLSPQRFPSGARQKMVRHGRWSVEAISAEEVWWLGFLGYCRHSRRSRSRARLEEEARQTRRREEQLRQRDHLQYRLLLGLHN